MSKKDISIQTQTVCAGCRRKSKTVASGDKFFSKKKADRRSRGDVVDRMENAGIDVDEGQYMTMDGYDDCFIGMVEQFGQPLRTCYDLDKVIKKMTAEFRPEILKALKDNNPDLTAKELKAMADDEADTCAWEWYDFNILGSWVGETTPVFLRRM